MKNIISVWLAAAVLSVLAAGCSSSEPEPLTEWSNEIGSTLKTDGEYKISTFMLASDQLPLYGEAAPGEVTFLLTSQENGSEYSFNGEISAAQNGQGYLCSIRIPSQQTIPDGNYDLKIRTGEQKTLNTLLSVAVRSEMVSSLLGSSFIYGIFTQKGTADDPYGVTDSLFADFLAMLQKDPSHGEGAYFVQTEDVSVTRQAEETGKPGICAATFAGTYDGGNHTLEFAYAPAGSDRGNAVGLFRELADKAVVKNLVLQADIVQAADTVGTVAAFSTGNVILENITIAGSISDVANRVGGLLGLTKNGTVMIHNCVSAVTISSTGNEVGGLIGRAENVALTVAGISTGKGLFQPIEGEECVGGAVGSLAGSFSFSEIGFSHPADSPDAPQPIISGGRYTGALIGRAEIDADCTLSGVTVALPVGGTDYTGGFIGELTASGRAGVSFDACAVEQSGAAVAGHDCVGGFIGRAQVKAIEFLDNSQSLDCQNNRMEVGVTGDQQVGGIFGYCLTGRLTFTPGAKVGTDHVLTISASIIEGSVAVGGFAGFLSCDTPILLDENLELASTMDVNGTQNIGGFAGWAEKTEISGTTIVTPDPLQGIVLTQDYSVYAGQINGKIRGYSALNAGGVIGYGSQVTLKQLYATGSVSGQSYVGGIAGRLDDSSVISCASRCGILKGNYAGGIVGYLSDSQAERLANYFDINGSFYVGGIAGYMAGTVNIDRCANFGAVNGDLDLGGIAGYGAKGVQTITDCGNFGAITCLATPFEQMGVGGIMGINISQCIIRGCANHAPVSVARGDRNLIIGVGGIAGFLGNGSDSGDDILVERCSNSGLVETTAGAAYKNRLGGIVGQMNGGTTEHNNSIANCYNRGGAVSGMSQNGNGGIAGMSGNYTAVTYSFNSGLVESGNGGVGYYDNATDDIETTGLYIEKGSGQNWNSTEFDSGQKSLKSSFPEFDFEDIWEVDGTTNDGYPFLRDCYFQFTEAPQQ